MMLKLNKNMIFILLILLMFTLIPLSFANDVNDNVIGSVDEYSSTASLNLDADNMLGESNNVYVDINSVSDVQDGSEANPYKNISIAVNNANDGSTIYVANGSYEEYNIILSKSVNIIGFSPDKVIIDAKNKGRIFDITGAGVTVKLENLTLTNGNASGTSADGYGGAIRAGQTSASAYNQVNLNLNNVVFDNNYANTWGGAFYISHGQTKANVAPINYLTVTNCTFKNNLAREHGGAIYTKANTNITKSIFSRNKLESTKATTGSQYGGAIYINFAYMTLEITSCLFEHNNATGKGGALYYTGPTSSIIKYNAFINNTAVYVTGTGSSAKTNIDYAVSSASAANTKKMDLNNNWWGSNDVNLTKEIAFYNVSSPLKYAKLDLTVNPSEIATDETSNISASFKWDDDSVTDIDMLPLRIVKYTSNGTLSEDEVDVGSDTIFSANEGGTYYINASVDDEIVSSEIVVTAPLFKIVDFDAEDIDMTYGEDKVLTVNVTCEGESITVPIAVMINGEVKDNKTSNNGQITFENLKNWTANVYTLNLTVDTSEYKGNKVVTINIDKATSQFSIDDEKTLEVGENYTIAHSGVIPVNGEFEYETNDSSIVSVKDNVVTAVASGTANITVTLKESQNYTSLSKNIIINVIRTPYWYVDDSVEVSGNGKTKETAFKTIEEAVNVAIDNDTIYVLEGEYSINDTIRITGTDSKSLAIIGEGEVILKSPKGKLYFNLGGTKNYTLFGLIFDNIQVGSNFVSAVSAVGYTTNINLINCTFKNNKAGSVVRVQGESKIINCTFINNEVSGKTTSPNNVAIGLIDYVKGDSLIVNYCNFIDNDYSQSGVEIFSNGTSGNLDYNFWGSNDGPSADAYTQGKFNLSNYIIINACIDEPVEVDSVKNIDFTFQTDDGHVLDQSMPTVTFKLSSYLGNNISSNITVMDNKANATYVANKYGDELINILLKNKVGNLTFNISKPVENVSFIADNIEMTYSEDKVLTVNVTCNGESITVPVAITINNEIKDNKTSTNGQIIFDDLKNWTANNYTINLTVDTPDYKGNKTIIVAIEKASSNFTVDSDVTLFVGENKTVAVSDLVPENATLLFESGNESIVKINDNQIVAVGKGNTTVNVIFEGDDNYNPVTKEINVMVDEDTSDIISASNVTKYFHGSERFKVGVCDYQNNPIANKNITITINGRSYNRTTNDTGEASIPLNLNSGVYNVTTTVDNSSVSSTVTILSTVNGTDITKFYKNGTQYYATFLDTEGNYLKNGTAVKFNINGVEYTRKISGNEGQAKLNINLLPGEYTITATNPNTTESASNTIKVIPKIMENNNITKYFRNETQYTVKVVDDNGNAVGAGELVKFNINGAIYVRKTNESGIAKLNINLGPGDYIITAEYNESSVSNSIKVLPTLTAQNLTKKYGDNDSFVVTLVDGQGNAFSNQTITFNINGVLYNRTTNSSGQARLNIRLPQGEYVITSAYESASISNAIKIEN